MDHPDQDEYRELCGPAMLKRSVNMLIGIVEGIASDCEVAQSEIDLLKILILVCVDRQNFSRVMEEDRAR
jgi:hypothetical protein